MFAFAPLVTRYVRVLLFHFFTVLPYPPMYLPVYASNSTTPTTAAALVPMTFSIVLLLLFIWSITLCCRCNIAITQLMRVYKNNCEIEVLQLQLIGSSFIIVFSLFLFSSELALNTYNAYKDCNLLLNLDMRTYNHW